MLTPAYVEYDVFVDFQTGVDKLDLAALGTSAGNVLIYSAGVDTVVYVTQTVGVVTGTDLAMAFVGANAITTADMLF